MLELLLIGLFILWLLGYLTIPGITLPDMPLFDLNGYTVTLWDALIFFLIVGIIGVLPSPFRQIAGAFLFLWVLATTGIIAIANLSSLLVFAIIVGLVFYLFSGRRQIV